MSEALSQRLRSPAPYLLMAAVAIAILVWPYRLRFPFDDTFISFRYAEHLAGGHGLVWNIGGPHTEGYTNFLFIAILAVARLLTRDLLLASQLIGIAANIATLWLIYRTGLLRSRTAGVLAAALYAFSPLTWVNALSGMETSLAVMLVAAIMLCGARSKYSIAFFLCFLAALVRPEAALLAPLIISLDRPRAIPGARLLAQFGLYFVLPCAVYACWKYFYFGNLLPNSFYLKVLGPHTRLPGLQYVRLFLTSVMVLIVATLTMKRPWQKGIRVAALWTLLLCTFYIFVLPLEGLYDRFLMPTLPALSLLAAIAIASRLQLRSQWIAGALLVIANLVVLANTPRTRQALGAHEDIWDESLTPLTTLLQGLPNKDSVLVGYGDAGYVVYHSGIRHLDLFGLNDTPLAHAESETNRRNVIAKERPALLLLPYRLAADSSAQLIENADGVAEDPTYAAVAALNIFPNPVVLLVDSVNPRSSSIFEYIRTEGTKEGSGLRPAPRLLRRTIER